MSGQSSSSGSRNLGDALRRGESQAAPTAARVESEDHPFASVLTRSIVCIIDIVILVVVILIGASVVNAVFGSAVRLDPYAVTAEGSLISDNGLIMLNAVVTTLLNAGYFVGSWTMLGGTPGQLLFKLQVRREADGGTLRSSQAILRWILLFPPCGIAAALAPDLAALIWGSAPVWYLILLITTVGSPTKQGLHDRLAHTVVRKSRRRLQQAAGESA